LHTRFYHCFHRQGDDEVSMATTEERLRDIVKDAKGCGQIGEHEAFGVLDLNGATICVIELDDEDHTEAARGYSLCSIEDQFSRPKGRRIAQGRALKALGKGRALKALGNPYMGIWWGEG